MAPAPHRMRMYTKIIGISLIVAVGGPAFTAWITPTQEELRARYNPDLLKRSLEGQQEREEEFNNFVMKLKEYSKSDKSIWYVIKEEEEKRKAAEIQANRDRKADAEKQREQMRRESGLGR